MCWMLNDSGAVDNELNCGVFALGGAKVRNVTVMLIQAKIPILFLSEGYEAMPLRDSHLHLSVQNWWDRQLCAQTETR